MTPLQKAARARGVTVEELTQRIVRDWLAENGATLLGLDPCAHPERNGRHDWYYAYAYGGAMCRACGAWGDSIQMNTPPTRVDRACPCGATEGDDHMASCAGAQMTTTRIDGECRCYVLAGATEVVRCPTHGGGNG